MQASLISGISLSMASSMSSASPPKIALITGSNKGIGKEIVRRFYNEPNTITILACRSKTLGEKACKDIIHCDQNDNERLVVCPLDLTDEKSIHDAAIFVKERFGKLDVLINNAAICFNDPTLYGKVPHTPFEKQAAITIQTNFFGTLKVTEAMIPLMLLSDSPRIINVASAAGRLSILQSQELIEKVTSESLSMDELKELMTDFIHSVENGTHRQKGYPNTCYGMSKLGIIAMTKIIANKYSKKDDNDNKNDSIILCNAVDPGYCATDQNNFQGYVPAERGSLTPFLLSTLPADAIGRSGSIFFEEQEIAW